MFVTKEYKKKKHLIGYKSVTIKTSNKTRLIRDWRLKQRAINVNQPVTGYVNLTAVKRGGQYRTLDSTFQLGFCVALRYKLFIKNIDIPLIRIYYIVILLRVQIGTLINKYGATQENLRLKSIFLKDLQIGRQVFSPPDVRG